MCCSHASGERLDSFFSQSCGWRCASGRNQMGNGNFGRVVQQQVRLDEDLDGPLTERCPTSSRGVCLPVKCFMAWPGAHAAHLIFSPRTTAYIDM